MSDLPGAWRLLEWDCTLDGRFHSHPFGREAQGQLIYTAAGFMSAILMQPGRPHFAHPNLASASDAEKITAVNGCIAYAGTYTVDGNHVRHHVQFSLLPNWVGTDLVRELAWLKNGELRLSTLPERTRSGKIVINRLRWARE